MSGDRYISQNALITEIAKIHGNLNTRNVGQAIWDTPTADVVEVVRCKDCKYWCNNAYDPIINREYGSCTCEYWEHPTEYFEMADNDYCSYGERREENEG